MQVSWIDADRIKTLVAQLAPLETCVESAPILVELDTTPQTMPEGDDATGGFAVDWTGPSQIQVPSAAMMETHSADSVPPELQEEFDPETNDEGGRSPLHNPAAALPLSRIRDKLRAIRQRATDAGILTRTSEVVPVTAPAEARPASPAPMAQEALNSGESPSCQSAAESHAEEEKYLQLHAITPQASAFEVPHGSREVRLAAFAVWARKVLHEDCGHVLVMNDDGEVLCGGDAKTGLVLSTMMACGAAIRASVMSAYHTPPVIHQPLASGHVLTVIPCETSAGIVHAAVSAPAGLTQEQAQVLRTALRAALN